MLNAMLNTILNAMLNIVIIVMVYAMLNKVLNLMEDPIPLFVNSQCHLCVSIGYHTWEVHSKYLSFVFKERKPFLVSGNR